ncbi:MAG: GNAT family N-acetyltransferase [Atribacterota bacterium]|jgi:Leucine-rich repeat (LRR) protein/ribosomal protein S18 acetylase RimI-like enzyme|nr:GNAT family N-acetyltransferase [Atribacterota bacterium]
MYDYEWDRLRIWLEQYGAIPESVTKKEELTRLDLSKNNLKELPQEIGILSNLVVLNLANNKLTKLPESFAKLKALSNLDLRRNTFENIPESLFSLELRSLNLSSNRLDSLAFLEHFKELRVIDLSHNNIEKIDLSLEPNNQLRTLNLSHNFLRDIAALFESVPHLERLVFSTNFLQSIPESIGCMRALEELDISDNHLTSIDPVFFTLNIERLVLSGNQFGELKLEGLELLESLSLDENPLKYLEIKENFAPYLQEFSCDSCALDSLVLPPSIYMRSLCYASNHIKELPAEIEHYAMLQELDLEANEIVSLPDTLANMNSLHTLYIKDNPLNQDAKKVIEVLDPQICDIRMKTGVEIQKATSEDLEAMAKLLAVLFAIESDFEIDEQKQYMGIKRLYEDERSDLLVAKHEGKVVGMVTMQRLISSAEGDNVGQIEDLVVEEGYRKMGIGSRLINRMRSLAHQHGYKRIQLAADIHNDNALAFYTRRGFRKTHLNVYHYKVQEN